MSAQKHVPNGVSTSTVWYSSSALVGTPSAGIPSNQPSGWHRFRRSVSLRLWSVPVINNTRLSIIYAYLGRDISNRQLSAIDKWSQTYVM